MDKALVLRQVSMVHSNVQTCRMDNVDILSASDKVIFLICWRVSSRWERLVSFESAMVDYEFGCSHLIIAALLGVEWVLYNS